MHMITIQSIIQADITMFKMTAKYQLNETKVSNNPI